METLLWGYAFLEAPRVDAEGRLYFSDVIGGGVYRRGLDGTVETIVPKRRGVGGLLLHADGGVVVAGRDVSHVGPSGTRTLLTVDGAVGFNDMTADAAGRVYVGSMRSGAMQEEGRIPSELWRIDVDGRTEEVYGNVDFPNGVGFSPDGATLYHSNYSAAEVLAHDVDGEGRAGNRRVFVRVTRGRPDGLAVDAEGGVWVALGPAGCVARFRADGALDRTLDVPARFVTSLCFGGRDGCDLYVVTADNAEDPSRGATIFRTRVGVAGVATPLARV